MGWVLFAAIGYGLSLLLAAAAIFVGLPKWANTKTGSADSKAYGLTVLFMLFLSVFAALSTDLLLKVWP
jgi:hypothetical protein